MTTPTWIGGLDPAKFNQGPPAGCLDNNLGNATRNNPKLRSRWTMDESVGLARNFRFTERGAFTLRGEAFNVFNRVRWGNPNNQVGGASFGRITTQANDPRRMQLERQLGPGIPARQTLLGLLGWGDSTGRLAGSDPVTPGSRIQVNEVGYSPGSHTPNSRH